MQGNISLEVRNPGVSVDSRPGVLARSCKRPRYCHAHHLLLWARIRSQGLVVNLSKTHVVPWRCIDRNHCYPFVLFRLIPLQVLSWMIRVSC